jgi:hypothetical protein
MPRKQAWEARMDAFERRMQAIWEATQKEWAASNKLHLERMDKIERNLTATSRLLRAGARMLLDLEAAQKKLVENLTLARNGHKEEKQ